MPLACDSGLNLSRVGRSSVWLRHRKAGSGLALQQRQQILLLLLCVPESQQKLHVASIGSTAVENLHKRLDCEQSLVVEIVTSESHGKAPIMRAARQYLIHTFKTKIVEVLNG